MDLTEIRDEIRNFDGIKRKKDLGLIVNHFTNQKSACWFGEDAAVIEQNHEAILLSNDGIREDLMNSDPKLSGYYLILVNVLDILAMGGTPVGVVDIIATSSKEKREKILKGMREAIKKFEVPVLGGHVLPESSFTSLGGAIIGRAPKDSIIYSNTARTNDHIVAGIDLNGKIPDTCSLCWDSTRLRDKKTLKKQMKVMGKLGGRGLVSAGKDISNPGILGTLGMLLEYSGCGALVNINSIPRPESVKLDVWLKVYPGMGFLVTCKPNKTEEVISIFQEADLVADKIGFIEKGKRFEIAEDDKKITLFDFNVDEITGIRG